MFILSTDTRCMIVFKCSLEYFPEISIEGIMPLCVVAGLQNAFKAFGPVKIEWPGRDGKHPRYPPKGM